MTDLIEKIHGATVQHGPLNRRIYLMKLGDADPDNVVPALADLAKRQGYSKIFAKVPASRAAPFLRAGYRQEAAIPGFYNGTEAVRMLCSYPDPQRRREADPDALEQILAAARDRQDEGLAKALRPDACLRACAARDTREMADVYRAVFPSYPFPIHDPGYLAGTMRRHVGYFGIEAGKRLVALASAEMDPSAQNAEMTDFATLPDWRGNGFAALLLEAMERAMPRHGILTAYTIARARSPGMNITFARLGYRFGGRLANNTQIAGRIESMNVWYKPVATPPSAPPGAP